MVKTSYITIESRGSYGGYMQHTYQEDVASNTRDELHAKIRIYLAGRETSSRRYQACSSSDPVLRAVSKIQTVYGQWNESALTRHFATTVSRQVCCSG